MSLLSSLDLQRGVLLPSYLGDFPIDQLPRPPPAPAGYSFIANTDDSSRSGSHWFAVARPPGPHSALLLLLDPFAIPLHRILAPLRQWIGDATVKTLPFAIQPLTSDKCGAFCVFLLAHLPLFNYDVDRMTRTLFSEENLQANQNRVFSWWLNRVEGSME